MPLYNFEVEQSVKFFIQRECDDDAAAEELKQQLEDEGQVDMSEQMRNTDIEYGYDLEVTDGPALNKGTGEA